MGPVWLRAFSRAYVRTANIHKVWCIDIWANEVNQDGCINLVHCYGEGWWMGVHQSGDDIFNTQIHRRVTAVSIWGPLCSYWILIFQEYYCSIRTYTVTLLCQGRTFILIHKLFLYYFEPCIQLVLTTVFSEILLTMSVLTSSLDSSGPLDSLIGHCFKDDQLAKRISEFRNAAD